MKGVHVIAYLISSQCLWNGHFILALKEEKLDAQRDKIICFKSPGQITTEPRCGLKITLALVWLIFLPHVA